MIVDGLGGTGLRPAYCLALEASNDVDRVLGAVPLVAFPRLEAKFLAPDASKERDRVLGTAFPLIAPDGPLVPAYLSAEVRSRERLGRVFPAVAVCAYPRAPVCSRLLGRAAFVAYPLAPVRSLLRPLRPSFCAYVLEAERSWLDDRLVANPLAPVRSLLRDRPFWGAAPMGFRCWAKKPLAPERSFDLDR